MPIPYADVAYIPPEKLTAYLLDVQHPVGGSKATWFHGLGYDSADPALLERDILELVRISENFSVKDTSFGRKYVVTGKITVPKGYEVSLTTVWIIDKGNVQPRLVTAFPGAKP